MLDIAIVGAGISGLTLAYRLRRAGLNVRVFESQSRIGGWLHSIERDDFLIEKGPHSALGHSALLELVSDLGIEAELLQPSELAKRRYLAIGHEKGNERLAALPRSFLDALTTPILSSTGKMRLLLEPFISRTSAADLDVRTWVSRRLGRGFCEGVVAPALSGIWAADIGKLSCRSALPKIWELEARYGSLVLGNMRKEKSGKGGRPNLVGFRGGLSTLVRAFDQQLDRDIITSESPVLAISENGTAVQLRIGGATTGEVEAKRLVLTTPTKTTAELIAPFAPELAQKIDAVPYAPLGILHLSYDKDAIEHPLDGFGFLRRPRQGVPLLGATFTSSIFPAHAPADKHFLSAFVGGATNRDLADVTTDSVRRAVIDDLAKLLSARAEPTVVEATYIERAIPNYPLNHHELCTELNSFCEQHRRIHFLSNWIEGIGIPNRIELACDLADKLVNTVALPRTTAPRQRDEDLERKRQK